jgi:polysaccharide biosynthesis/export protein
MPQVDLDRLEKAKLKTGPYRVVPGDVLELTMPTLLQAATAAEVQAAQGRGQVNPYLAPYLARVRDNGAITLPAVGSVPVAGLSLAQIEEQVTEAYRSYFVPHPSVFVRVAEYKTAKVYVTGAVQTPGVYALQADQMTLSSLLTQAGGISEVGAAVVRLMRSGGAGPAAEAAHTAPPAASLVSAQGAKMGDDSGPILLPVVSTNIPYRDVALDEGDTVVVEPVQMPMFSVLGLVMRPGNFPYPPGTQYNLTQAIAYAGGLDPVARPRYATVYRLAEDGSVVRVPFHLIRKSQFTDALGTPIRPGDVVAVEHTPRTRFNTAVRDLLRINAGVYITGRDLWDRD